MWSCCNIWGLRVGSVVAGDVRRCADVVGVWLGWCCRGGGGLGSPRSPPPGGRHHWLPQVTSFAPSLFTFLHVHHHTPPVGYSLLAGREVCNTSLLTQSRARVRRGIHLFVRIFRSVLGMGRCYSKEAVYPESWNDSHVVLTELFLLQTLNRRTSVSGCRAVLL